MKTAIIKELSDYMINNWNFTTDKTYVIQHISRPFKDKAFLLYDDNGKALSFYEHELIIN